MAGPVPPGQQPPVAKVSDVVQSFRATKLFRSQKPDVSFTSLDFDDSGELLLSASNDESLHLYSCREGKFSKTLYSQKYGAHLARFTHHSQSIIYASTKVDDGIRYLSTHDNQFIRYFKGHTGPVTCLTMNPGNDEFLSCSVDDTVLHWDLRSSFPAGKLNLHTPYLAAYDPSATVFAVASPSTSSILLYDVRNYDKPPFATFDMAPHEHTFTPKTVGREWTTLSFSNDGKFLLLGTNSTSPGHFLLDAFDGRLAAFLARPAFGSAPPTRLAACVSPSSHNNNSGGNGGAVPGQGDVCFSPDGKFVLGGTGGDQDLAVWDVQNVQDKVVKSVAQLPFKARAAMVAYNPRLNVLASADKEVVLWVPDPHA
ncbi:histone H3 methyltransferase complex and RNA cleavage factor II complex, subunit SWD2 [Xylona heveae TC161]|uniref:Histone H3 methyltransferase complex and RNA cleavage factor II complex, subunit SWD2 n=1 Tax=Xylona heveae (strain CBS 132557 / TC161) TaxID=1328760 RepID=A0A165JV25_XYLHT|nr:histone H3 methyltransferase complex and RNA cleavage factor II complex, subunit SWD2 [Xylona heveae TC161]KZF26668.1 histone H3 methyltransferase complex and RNA cleavage factor II complex, subunit SWD2 [Xylona heveae TC161]